MTEQTAVAAIGTLHIEQEVTVAATPERVFAALTKDIAAWWGAPYLISDMAKALVLEPRPGGRFYEDWGEGQGGLWATVTSLKNNEYIELNGPLGMQGIVQGVIRFELTARDNTTIVKLSHRAMGEISEQNQANYTAGWQDLLETRLRAYVERGVHYGLGHEPPPA